MIPKTIEANLGLHPAHLEDLRKSGLNDTTIANAGIASVPPDMFFKKLGFNIPNLMSLYEIPYAKSFSRFKAFLNDGRTQYLQAKGTGNRLYIPPDVKPILNNAQIPLYITEGEKKSLKACQEGLYCIGLSGLWNWSNGNKELISDFDSIALEGRTVYITPDNDWLKPNRHGYRKNLKQAVYELAERLKAKGAKVYIVQLPQGDEKGLDDYLCKHTVEDFKKLPVKDMTSEKTKKPKRKRISQSDKLIQIASRFKLFHDDAKEAFAFIDNQATAIRSRVFKQRLAKELWLAEGKAPSAETLQQAINVIEAQAIFDGEPVRLFNRIGELEGKFFYDLADGRAVEVTPEGWIIKNSPILFRRYSHQQRQVEPKRGGDIEALFNFLNVSAEQRILTTVYLVCCLIPEIPKPLIYGYGDKGSGKTTASMTYKKLLDPSKIEVLITPRDYNEVVQILEHHAFIPLDNISSFPGWLSDLLSQACTGGGFQKRMLYTDTDAIIYKIKRAVLVNGINLLVNRPDLMDRTILLHMERIRPNMRRTEQELIVTFNEQRPYLLGAMFDALSEAMKIHQTLDFGSLPRMADFTVWGSAIAQALGYKIDEFLKAYDDNIKRQTVEIVSNNTLAQAVIQFMKDRDNWSGTVAEVYDELCRLVTVSREDRTFPKHSNKLRKHLERIKDNLRDYDIAFSMADFHTEKGVPITFTKLTTQGIANLSSGYSVSSELNKINELWAEDPLKIPEDPTKVSSGYNSLKNKGNEHPVDTEDKITILRGELKEAIYTQDEIKELEKLPKEDLLGIHRVKEVFENSKVNQTKLTKINQQEG